MWCLTSQITERDRAMQLERVQSLAAAKALQEEKIRRAEVPPSFYPQNLPLLARSDLCSLISSQPILAHLQSRSSRLFLAINSLLQWQTSANLLSFFSGKLVLAPVCHAAQCASSQVLQFCLCLPDRRRRGPRLRRMRRERRRMRQGSGRGSKV